LPAWRRADYKGCDAHGGWKAHAVPAAAQFLIVLDQAVMNGSISRGTAL
jgi:hypothetical protein